MVALCRIFCILITLVGFRQVQLTPCNIHKGLAVIFAQMAHQPFIHPVRKQQDLDVFLAEHLKVRRVFCSLEAIGHHIVNLVLAFLHAACIVLKGLVLLCRIGVGAGKAQELLDALLIARILYRTFLHHLAKLIPERLVLFTVTAGEFAKQIQHPPRECCAHGFRGRVILQELAGNIQRQVVGIHHTFDKAQVHGQKLLGIIHDEDALHIELEAARFFPLIKVKRRFGRNVNQACIVQLALYPVMAPFQRVLKIMGCVLVKSLVLIF